MGITRDGRQHGEQPGQEVLARRALTAELIRAKACAPMPRTASEVLAGNAEPIRHHAGRAAFLSDLSRIDRVWNPDAGPDTRTQEILSAMPAGRDISDAWAQALMLSESGGLIPTPDDAATLARMLRTGERDVAHHCRAGGIPPESFISILDQEADRAAHKIRLLAESPLCDEFERYRAGRDLYARISADLSARMDRGWSTRTHDMGALFRARQACAQDASARRGAAGRRALARWHALTRAIDLAAGPFPPSFHTEPVPAV